MKWLQALACLAIIATCGMPAHADTSPCPAKPYAVSTSAAVYGTDATFESLDLYQPTGQTGEPLVIFVHGDNWTRGDKAQYKELGDTFAACGIALAAIDYKLAPQARVDVQAGDVARAVKWALDNAVAKGYARAKLFLMGHGSGAELAAFSAVNVKLQSGASVPVGAIAGVVALDGSGYDPSTQAADATANPSRYSAFFAAFGSDPSQWKQYDISGYLTGKEPRFLVVHGADDFLASEAASAQLVHELQHVHDNVNYVQPDGRDHSGVLVNLVRTPDDPTLITVERLILGS